jgi:sulfhydrogenase subunit gamma (sulfur reductase)
VPEAAAYPARVTRAWSESETLRGLAFRADEVSRRHRAPGQYVRIRVNGDENPYALASEPGAPELELLFKPDTELTGAMAALRVGAAIRVGAPEGSGFPLADHGGRDVILVAAGSGIAPLRAVVRSVLHDRARYGAVTLFYGQREPGHFAYSGEWEEWRAGGVEVIPVASGEGSRRVQDALLHKSPRLDNAVVYLAGMKRMIAEVRRRLVEMGLDDTRVFLNY